MTMSLEPAAIHFIGVGGSGMAPLALWMARRGWTVSGSDPGAGESACARLKGAGITLYRHHSAAHIGPAQVVVFSSAIADTNEELAAARARGQLTLHRSELLAAIGSEHTAIAVAGSHGKTTTTALIAQLMTAGGADPSAIVGGSVLDFGGPVRWGRGSHLVFEADESDGSFLRYRPSLAVITNIAADHLELYGDEEGVRQAFRRFFRQLPADATVILSRDDDAAWSLAGDAPGAVWSFGFHPEADYRGDEFSPASGELGSRFRVHPPEGEGVTVASPMLGRHNAANALAAIATAHVASGISLASSAPALAGFQGVKRRLTPLLRTPALTLYDDYGHNPGKIAATLTTLREAAPRRRLIAIFEPHRYTRIAHQHRELTAAFAAADEVIVTPIYASGEAPDPAWSPQRLAREIAATSGCLSRGAESWEDVEREACRSTGQRTLVTLGAGDVSAFGERLCKALKRSEPPLRRPSPGKTWPVAGAPHPLGGAEPASLNG